MNFEPRKNIFSSKPKLQEEHMKTVTYTIPNISCGHCVRTIQNEVGELEGVKSVQANNDTKQTVIVFEDPATEAQILELLKEINYPAEN